MLIYLMKDSLDSDTDALIRDYSNQVYVSSTSVKEFMNLVQSGRVKISRLKKISIVDLIENELYFKILYVAREHLLELEKLPSVPNHNDPNDRMIIAQAISNRLELVSSDTKFVHYKKYGLQLVKAEYQGGKK
ncbi:MAG: type II toxin-antitoxin system VapC family toxin [Paludibacteraceae bacterium]|nr:type II toxin-antitoxin system VapC family toxin [Paludibacteraceae bacterium]